MRSSMITADVTIGVAAGLFATAITDPMQKGLYRLMPDSLKRREEEVRPGSPTTVAAEKLAGSIGLKLNQRQTAAMASAIHYGSGVPWGAVYPFLRRHSGMTPVGAALALGASMFLILDEALTPAAGFSAPDREYPPLTHARGFVVHLLFGAAVAATAEALFRLAGTTPERSAEQIAT